MNPRMACVAGWAGAVLLWCTGCAEEQPAPPAPPPSAGEAPQGAEPADEGAAAPTNEDRVAASAGEGAAASGDQAAASGIESSPSQASPAPAALPTVVMSMAQRATVLANVGDEFPAAALSDLQGTTQELRSLYGTAATVVFFWRSDNPHSLAQLADCGPDVLDLYGAQGVAVIGINTGELADAALTAADKYGVKFPLLSDADGAFLGRLSTAGPPRVFVLDAEGKIAWFDIEYSRATRENLDQALRYLAAQAGSVAGP